MLAQSRERIEAADAEILLAHVLGRPRGWLFAHDDVEPDAAQGAAFERLVARRQAGEPVAYLTGTQGFWTLDLAVTPDTLVPRPETELLVEQALARIPADARWTLADLGTGSGAIAISLACERDDLRVVATDRSTQALAVARRNAQRLAGEALASGRLQLRQGNWWEAVDAQERFDLVASNPPYVEAGDPHLAQGDLRFEPVLALVAGPDGLAALRAIVAGTGRHLLRGGWLLLEHGFDQGEALRALLADAGFASIATLCDAAALPRVTFARKPE